MQSWSQRHNHGEQHGLCSLLKDKVVSRLDLSQPGQLAIEFRDGSRLVIDQTTLQFTLEREGPREN